MNSLLRCTCVFVVGLASMLPAAARAAAHSSSPDGLWHGVDESSIAPRQARRVVPVRYQTLALDLAGLREQLAAAPQERAPAAKNSTAIVSLPRPDGTFARFAVVESPIMAPELARKYPELRTYLGQGIDDATESLRFDTTPSGLHAQVLSADGTWFVDPYQDGDVEHYVAYSRRDHATGKSRDFTCGFDETDEQNSTSASMMALTGMPVPEVISGDTLRTFRLALAATGEYTQFHGGTVAAGLAGMVTTMNRVNAIFERDLAVRMVLVANNDLLVYTNGATDPYTNNSGSTMLGENQSNITSVIGGANYDIGHVFSTGGGGVVSGSVCNNGNKARGVTGRGAPIGDSFDVDYVAHEMGHQFTAPHTFNSTNCSASQLSAGSAFEVGSGTTIMAYAGICGVENVQPNSDDYFHRTSLTRILGFVAGSCAITSNSGNAAPVVSTPAAFTIPQRTPFALTAVGNDPDGDAITYLWEQFDLGPSTNGGGAIVDDGSRPLFRPVDPVTSPIRILPSLRFILDNANVPPASAPLPGTSTPSYYTGETLPTTNRTLNFRVTARDNRAGAGGTNEAGTALTVTNAAGPFAVTAPNTSAVVWAAGTSQSVTWAVANTNQPPVDTSQVRIALSVDGGYTFPIVLADATANDGVETIVVPAGAVSTQARLRVAAVGNVYFDISDASFAITGADGNTPPSIVGTGNVSTRQGSPTATANVATVADAQTGPGALVVTASGAPPELGLSLANNAGTVALSATASCQLVAPTSANRPYPILLTVTDGAGGSASTRVNVNVSANMAPTSGTYSGAIVPHGTTRTLMPASAPSDGNGNLFAMRVSPATLPGGGTVAIDAGGVVTVTTVVGTTPGTYPIRASAEDTCGATGTVQFNVTVTEPGVLFLDGFE